MKKNDTLKSIIVLVSICLVIAAAMAGINMITKDRIAAVQAEKEAKALEAVLPENAGFEKLEDIPELPTTVSAVYRDKDGEGIAMLLSASGYDSSNPISIAVGFDKDGKSGTLRYVNGQGEKELPFGICYNAFGKFPQLGYSDEYGGVRTTDGSMYDAAVSAAWLQNNKLGIKVQIIDKYLGNALFIFGFKGDLVTVRMSKTAEDFLDEYQGDLIGRRATV